MLSDCTILLYLSTISIIALVVSEILPFLKKYESNGIVHLAVVVMTRFVQTNDEIQPLVLPRTKLECIYEDVII